jgi:hypothetical protein
MQKCHSNGHQGQILRKLRGPWWLFYHEILCNVSVRCLIRRDFEAHVVSKAGRSRSLNTNCMSHPGEVWRWKDLQSLYTSMCSFHCGHFFKSVKCIDRSLLSVVHSNSVEICWSQLQQCVGLTEYTAAAVSSCGKHQHSEWGPGLGHMRPRSQHSGMPIARPRRSPDIHHPKGHQGALTYQSEKDSEERVQRVQ